MDITSRKSKREAVEKLNKELDLMKKRKKLKKSGTKTEIRIPTDYTTHMNFEERSK